MHAPALVEALQDVRRLRIRLEPAAERVVPLLRW